MLGQNPMDKSCANAMVAVRKRPIHVACMSTTIETRDNLTEIEPQSRSLVYPDLASGYILEVKVVAGPLTAPRAQARDIATRT